MGRTGSKGSKGLIAQRVEGKNVKIKPSKWTKGGDELT